MVDDIRNTDLPALASHLEKGASGLALQTLNFDVHICKCSLTIQGIMGEADEDESMNRWTDRRVPILLEITWR